MGNGELPPTNAIGVSPQFFVSNLVNPDNYVSEKPSRRFCSRHIIYRIYRIGGMSAAEDAENAGGGIAAHGLVHRSSKGAKADMRGKFGGAVKRRSGGHFLQLRQDTYLPVSG